jgi:hypothetical protein
VITAPFLPDFPAKSARGRQDSVTGFGTGTLVLPWLGVLASGDYRLRPTFCNRFVTGFGVVGTIVADARHGHFSRNLVEQAREYRCIASGGVGHFNGPDFQRGRVNPKVDLAPLATIVGPVLFSLPLALAQHLDARAVDQEVQSRCRRLHSDRHRKILLTPANGTEVGYLPVQARELEQALWHPHRLAQSQVKQALDGQAELDRRLAVLRATAPLAAGTAVPAHALVEPNEQGAARLQRRVVIFPVGRSVLRFCWRTHAVSLSCAHARPPHGPICATKSVVGAITADAGNDSSGNWSKRHRSIGASPVALSVTSMAWISTLLASAPKLPSLAPLLTIVGSRLLGLPITFVDHFNTNAVD